MRKICFSTVAIAVMIAAAAVIFTGCGSTGSGSVEQSLADAELARSIDRFLRTLPEKECCVFLRRYWYVDSMLEIAHRYHMAEGTVKSMLFRTRRKLKAYLEEEGVYV